MGGFLSTVDILKYTFLTVDDKLSVVGWWLLFSNEN